MGLSLFRSRVCPSRATLAVSAAIALCWGAAVVAQPSRKREELIGGRRAAAGEILVRFQQNSVTATLLQTELGVDRDERLGAGQWHVLHSNGRSAANLLAALRARSGVLAAEPNYRVAADGAPADLVSDLWALHNTGQQISDGSVGTPGADIAAVRAWDTTTGTHSIVVATVDTGIMASHEDLAANLWSAPQAFSVNIGGNVVNCAAGTHGFNAITRTCSPNDDNGHGTHVAGSIGAAGDNGIGVVGVNWTTSIMALKFLDADGNGYVSDAINAIEFAIQAKRAFAATGEADVRVLNNSWSGGDYSQALSDEIQRAAANDMLFVAASGNDAADIDTHASYPAGYAGANVIAVASTDGRDQLSSFSDYGARSIHIAAPGTSIYSTYVYPDNPDASAYTSMSGTSMAAAYVSGAAALVLARCEYSTGALRDALLSHADTLDSLSGRVESGRRLDAATAVESCASQPTTASDLVLHAADVPAVNRHGAWAPVADGSASGGAALQAPDAGWASTSVPLASPSDYFDVSFSAPANIPYHVWLRMRAASDSKWNDSVWVQFSDALVDGAPAYSINTSSGYPVNLEACSGCGVSGWGWEDGAYWMAPVSVTFSSSGSHTLRVQTREDGVAIDQIVLSASTYLSSSPGQVKDDTTPVGNSSESGGSTEPPPSGSPFTGSATTLPGTMNASDFDNGGDGIAYHDTTPGNSGGAYRTTDVDIEPSSEGGYSVGWIDAGEWLHYTVDVSAPGDYVVSVRVASPDGGGSLRVAFDASDASAQVAVPSTGGWQNWTTVYTTITLATAGVQPLRLLFDTNCFNVKSIALTAASTSSSSGGLAPYGGTPRAVPGAIQAADFDNGGEGIAFHDTTPGNTGGAYRQTDVDIQPGSEGGYGIGWIGAGEWLNYTVNVSAPGNYTAHLRVAAPAAGGLLHIGFNTASNVWTQISVPATGDWQQWTTIDVPVTLGAGQQQITLYFDTGGYNVSWIAVDGS